MNVPHMAELCKHHASHVQQPDEQASKLDASDLEASSPVPAASPETLTSEQTNAVSLSSGTGSDVQHGTDGGHEKAGRCNSDVIVVCRRGNDSQQIVQSLRGCGVAAAVDLIGGLSAWSQLDTSFPGY